MVKTLLVGLLILLSTGVNGQGLLKCGNDRPDVGDVDRQLGYQKSLQNYLLQNREKSSRAVETVFLQLHIVRRDDGSDIVSMDDIMDGIDRTNVYFQNADMHFEICDDIVYLNSSKDSIYDREVPNDLVDPETFNPFALNIYYFAKTVSSGNTVCGLGGRSIWMGCPRGITLAHEIGHHYSLAHVHGRYNFDPPDYSNRPAETNGFPTPVSVEGAVRYYNMQRDDNQNQIFDCLETGDGVCDTPAEPVALGGAYDFQTCSYIGDLRDHFGDLFVPDPGNVMSYGSSCGEEFFTSDQYEKARFSLEFSYLNELCGDCTGSIVDWTVSTTEDFGKGSLRWACACNQTEGKKVNITFDIPHDNVGAILLERDLTRITADEVVIDGLNKATGNKVRIDGHGLRINARKITIKNLIIQNVAEFRYAVLASGYTEYLEITDSEVYGSYGVAFIEEVGDLVLKSNKFGGPADQAESPNVRGMDIQGAVNVLIGGSEDDSNVFSNHESGTGLTIDTILGGEISHNEFSNNASSGLRSRYVQDVNISNNQASGNGQIGLAISSADNIEIKENELHNNGRGGIVLDDGRDIEIIDNSLARNSWYGVFVRRLQGLKLINNSLTDGQAFSNGIGGFGFFASDRCDDIVAMSNTITNNANAGMVWDSVLIGAIEGNILEKNLSRGIEIRHAQDVKVVDNVVSDHIAEGFLIDDAKRLELIDNEITNTRPSINGFGGYGFRASRRCENVIIKGNLISDNTNTGMRWEEVIVGTIENNTIERNGSGLLFSESERLELSDNVVTNNRPAEGEFGGIGVWSTGKNEQIIVRGNLVSGNGDVGMSLGDIESGTIENNTLESNGSSGMRIGNGQDVKIFDNTLREHMSNGLTIGSAQGLELIDNVITQNQISTNTFSGYGIRASGRCSDVIVMGNVVSDNSNIGMRWDSVVVGAFQANTLDHNTSGGLLFRYIQDVALESNTISNTLSRDGTPIARGIDISGAKTSSIASNIIYGTNGTAINVSGSQTSISIGSDDMIDANEIYSNVRGLSISSSPSVYIGINDLNCNEEGAMRFFGTVNEGKNEPIITNTEGLMINGTADANDDVFLYVNTDSCMTCEMEQYLGRTAVGPDGEWSFDITNANIGMGETVAAISSQDAKSSRLSACTLIKLPVGCNDQISSFPFTKDFEDQSLGDFLIFGGGLEVYNSNFCQDNDQEILYYNARDGNVPEVAIHTQTVDLLGAQFASLAFDLAHASSFTNRQSRLEIGVSTDCGLTYEVIYDKSTFSGLRTTTSLGSPNFDFFPTSCDQWRTEEIDLLPFSGNEVVVRITASYDEVYGQNIFLDNIVIDRGAPCPAENSIDGGFYVDIDQSDIVICEGENVTLEVSFDGGDLSWELDDIPLEDFHPDTNLTESGTYVATVRDRFGCTFSDSVRLDIEPTPLFDFGPDVSICEGEEVQLSIDAGADTYIWTKDAAQVDESENQITISESGLYIGVASTDLGCADTDTINIIVNALPVGSISESTTICNGDETEIMLVADEADITWTYEDAPFSPTSALAFSVSDSGVYTATIQNTAGCITLQSTSVEIAPLVEVSFISDTILCAGQSVNIPIMELENVIPRWYLNNELISEEQYSREINETGEYKLELEDQFGCIYSNSVTVEVVEELSVEIIDIHATSFCQGDVVSLVAETNGEIVSWEKDGEEITTTSENLEVTESGQYTVVVTNAAGCFNTAAKELTFRLPPIVDLGDDLLLCEGNQGAIGIEDIGLNYRWTLDDSTLETVGAEVTPMTTGLYRLEVTDELGCSSMDDIAVEIVPGPAIDLAPEVFICPGETTNVMPTTNALELTWSVDGVGVEANTDGSIDVSEPGAYVLTGLGDAGCVVEATVLVTEYEIPIISLDAQYSICDGESAIIEASLENYSFIWSRSAATLQETGGTLTTGEPGVYVVQATNDQGCMSEAEFEVLAKESPELTIADAHETCPGEAVTLEASGEADSFMWILEGEIVEGANTNALIAATEGLYRLIGTNESGCSTEVLTEVVFSPTPLIALEERVELCPGESIVLDPGDHVEYTWSNGETTREITLTSPDPNEEQTEVINIEVSNELGCITQQSIEVIYRAVTNPKIMTDMELICPGSETVISVIDGDNFEWIGRDATTASITVSPDRTSIYQVRVGNICDDDTVLLEATIEVSDITRLEITPDTCITSGEQIQLSISGAERVLWADHSSFVTSTAVPDPIVMPLRDHTYNVMITDSLGCMFDHSIDVCVGVIEDLIEAPNVLTLGDGDGYNDALIFEPLDQFPGAELTIMNRWGRKVFEHPSYQSDDRLFVGLNTSGQELSAGTYFYILQIPGFEEVIKSSLTIIR